MPRNRIEALRLLIKTEIEASNAYTQALEHREVPEIHRQLSSFRADHRRHAQDLIQLVQASGGAPPGNSLRERIWEKLAAVESRIGTPRALRAVRRRERASRLVYLRLMREETSAEIRELIETNLRDEEKHLEYLNALLAGRPWDTPHSSAARRAR